MDEKRLERLERLLGVVYGLLFVLMLQYLPKSEDMAWRNRPLGLVSLLADNAGELLRIAIGVGITLAYWNVTHRLLGPLVRTSGLHSSLVLVQTFVLPLAFVGAVAFSVGWLVTPMVVSRFVGWASTARS